MKKFVRFIRFIGSLVEILSMIILFPFGVIFHVFKLYGYRKNFAIIRAFGYSYVPFIQIYMLSYYYPKTYENNKTIKSG